MSDINPMWRIKVMTEVFGVVGEGWMYTIDKMWNSPAANDEQITSVQISLFYRLENGEWSAAIPGIGGSKLVAKESSGLHSNDEAVKMATTDALGVAMKHLGVAADVYMGLWDGSKYIEPKDAPNFPKTVNTPKEAKKAVKEAVPQAGMKPVDEAFPKDSPSEDLLSVSDLRKAEIVEKLKSQSKKGVPEVLEAINSLDQKEKHSFNQVVSLLTGETT
jgi:hypothetical protein